MSRSTDPVTELAALTAVDVSACDVTGAIDLAQRSKLVRGWLDRFDAGLATHLNELYEEGEGAPAADVLVRNEGISAAEARRRERRAKALDDAPSFGDALATGTVTAEHADALANATAKLDDAVKGAFFDREESLLDEASRLTPEKFGRHCRDLVDRITKDQGIERAERQRRQTTLSRSIDPVTGMFRLRGEFDPELGTKIWTALDAEIGAVVAEGGDRAADRNHVAAVALGNLVAGGHRAVRPTQAEISVLIDLPTIQQGLHEASVCETSGGVPLPPATARRLACDAKIIPVVLGGDGCALDVGRERRHANRAQRRALRAMYRTCAFDGCDVGFDRCEIHHLIEWELGGLTDLADLLPLCSRHHHVVHEGGWGLTLATDRTLTITRPDGELFAVCDPDVAETTGGRGRRGKPPDTGRRRPPDHVEPLPLAS
ncbi:DUF222 domain-containing protein [Ilumatobacter sp.]|uniref:HNH endonuclease signature motif containing protein n=1 Tax=Ilumatobacter sp. TaxID=1967498 RepID=UPI003AF4EA74